MKITILILITIVSLLTSCYKVYDPDIETRDKVLVVNGLITNKTEAYHILLSSANAFNSYSAPEPVIAANVYVTDDYGNSYIFREIENGNYISDSSQFTGQPGGIYNLHITTLDGQEYESEPQRLFPETYLDSIYAEFDFKEILDISTGLKKNIHGAYIFCDIPNQADTLPRLRLVSNLVTQYFYTICPRAQPCIYYYCWKTDIANPIINLTGGKYSVSSASIRKHSFCFLDDNPECYALDYSYRVSPHPTFYKFYMIHHRILLINLYTLNNDSYSYYKSLDEQIQSEGKLFDPIAAQLIGNIKCITNPEKKAIGFFEASSVCNASYVIDYRYLNKSQPSVIKTPYILPPEAIGYRINTAPPFWIY